MFLTSTILLKQTFIIFYIFLIKISIDLITTNDIHGVVDKQTAYFMNPEYPPTIIGGAGFYKYLEDLKKDDSINTLILDGGNFFQGTNFGMNDKGKTMVEWMNKLEYDVFVPGQYDFIFGVENLNNILKDANFSIVGANLENDYPENLWYGYIDEIRLWDVALQDSIINFHNINPHKISSSYNDQYLTNLIGFWDFRIDMEQESFSNIFQDIYQNPIFINLFTLDSAINKMSQNGR